MRWPYWLIACVALMLQGAACVVSSGSALAPAGTFQRRAPSPTEHEGTDRQKAQLLIGSATQHLDRCKLDRASEDVDRAIAILEERTWTSDAAYGHALVARGRLRFITSNDAAGAARDFEQAIGVFGRHERENIGALLGASWRLADCSRDSPTKDAPRAALERGFELAERALVPVWKATAAELKGYPELLALVDQYDRVADERERRRIDLMYRIVRWNHGEPWTDPPSPPPERLDSPRCQPTGENVSALANGVKDLRLDLSRCFEKARAKDAALRGAVRLGARIAADGSIGSVRGLSIGLPPETNTCFARAVAALRFKPPTDGVVTFVLPLTFGH